MTTRAANVQFLLAGMSNPTTGEPVESGTVYFYEAGTSTQKYVWTEIAKTNGYYSYSLDAVGAAQLYGEGNYKIVVKDSAGATVYTLDNVRLEYPYYGITSITETHTQVSQNDFILVDTSGGAVTINCMAAASWTRPLKIQRITGTNSITVDPNGSETIDGASTMTISSGAIVEIISDGSNLRTAGFRSSFTDADNDTLIQVEENSDEDIIRFDAGGIQDVVMIYSSAAPYAVYVSGGLYVSSGGMEVYGGIFSNNSNNAFTGGTFYPTTLKINENVAVTATSSEINAVCDAMPSKTSGSAGSLTITDPAAEVTYVDLGTLSSGDMFFASAYLTGTKGGTEGYVELGFAKKAGTGTVVFAHETAAPLDRRYYVSAGSVGMVCTVPGIVTDAGTMQIGLNAGSYGSDVTSGAADLAVIMVKKQ